MQNLGLLTEAIAALKQSRTSVKTLLEKNPTAVNHFADALTRRQTMDAVAAKPATASSLVAATNVATASNVATTPGRSDQAPPPSFLDTVSAARNLAPPSAPAITPTPIPAAQQNVIDSSLRSNYVYTVDPGGDRTLLGLEDRLRRATDAYDSTVASAKGGYCSWIPSSNGLPVYLNREQMISSAKENLQQAQQSFEGHKRFLANPEARSAAEVAYQIQHGAPSVGGPELSRIDQIIVQERRAGNTSTDGSILLVNKAGT